jgi:hypothetical protein
MALVNLDWESPDWREMGPLKGADVYRFVDEPAAVGAVRLRFDSGTAQFEVEPEFDTLGMSVPARSEVDESWAVPADVSAEGPWADVVGLPVLWGRRMINHRGYFDAYQLEFATEGTAVGLAIELVVVASALNIGVARFPK